jgi:hypothetical protein
VLTTQVGDLLLAIPKLRQGAGEQVKAFLGHTMQVVCGPSSLPSPSGHLFR